jgi:hypothetical protein
VLAARLQSAAYPGTESRGSILFDLTGISCEEPVDRGLYKRPAKKSCSGHANTDDSAIMMKPLHGVFGSDPARRR